MASDLSSVCTEANEILDNEKEEGEISLEDVSSSEDGPPYRYQSRSLGQCPHCLSTGHCATWCRSLTLNKKIFVRASQRKPLGKVKPYVRAEVVYVIAEDAGKENRRHHHHRHGHRQRAPPPAALLSEDLQPISSDSDLELVGLAKKKKARKKKRRKKSPSLSLSPSPVDMAIKESIHRGPTRRHQSPVRRKSQPQQQSHKSPPPRKLSPQRMKKLKKPVNGDSPLQSRGAVTKLLKKVKKLEPFSMRSKEKRSSLKDKLSNIIGGKKSDEIETVTVELKSKDKSPGVKRKEEIIKSHSMIVEERKKQDAVAEEEKKKEIADEEKKKENDEDLRQIILTSKLESTPKEPPESSQLTPQPPAKEEERPQEPDEDLQLRVIALRSAVMKKHRTRIARAKKQQQLLQQKQQGLNNEPVPRIESPFTSSFNEDFPLLAEICSPGSPLDPNKGDIYCPEDMELDSDMELDKEISMVLSGAEEETNNIVDGDSPYSPTDDLGSLQGTTDQPMDLSMYTPSKPTETPMHVPDNNRKSDTLDGSILESRPYSPSDATVYDPELPGVLGANANVLPPPLQPPPLPPLGIMPMMPGMPMNLLSTYPIIPMPGSFAPVNPMLTAPFIPFTPTTATTAMTPTSNAATQLIEEFETDLDGSPLVPIEPKEMPDWKFVGDPLYLPEMNKLPLPSLVPAPVLKCNKQLQKHPTVKKPSESLFRSAEMRPVTIEDDNKISGATFKPIKLPTAVKKAVTTQPAAAFHTSVEESVDSQKQIWPELEQDLRELEELEEQENRRREGMEERKKQEQREAEERKKQEQREVEELEKRKKQEQREAEENRRHEKEEAERRRKRERDEAERRRRIRETPIRRLRKKSVTPAPRARRRSARTPSRDIYRRKSSRSSRDSEGTSKSKIEDSKEKSDERKRKLSIDDDEQALREILLASLAKRKPNAKRKAALEAAKRKAALEATKATSDKENIAEKSEETCSTLHEVDKLKAVTTLETPAIINTPNGTAREVPLPPADLSVILMPAVLQQQQQQPTLKRPAPTLLPFEQPIRKVVKKLNAIPASTRAVNNAIRYQNLLIQRKLLAQQKLALYKTRFAVNNGQNSESPQIVQSSNEAPRFVISLNEDTESESEADDKKKENPTKTRPVLAIPTTDFEKSVDQFLKGVRLQQELLATTTTVTISKTTTPPIIAKTASSVTSQTVTTTINATATVAKVAVTTSAAVAKVAVTTSTTMAVPKVVPTTVTTSLPKERTVLNIPKPITTANIPSIPATPQAVKHLPASQQEEYRRLKRQIYEYEQLRLQKAKESATTVATTSQAQATMAKPINTSSSLSTSSTSPSPTVLTTSTPKAPIAKLMPKTQMIAAISPVTKPSNITPIVVTPTKIIHATSNVTTKTIAPTINPASKFTSNSITGPSSSKSVVVKVTQPDPSQLKLLSKITESLNSQKTLLNTAASKISSISSKSLRVLTMEQINQKTSKIQQKNNCVVMDDLNKTDENNVATEKKGNIEGEKMIKEKGLVNTIEKADATKESVKEVSLAAAKSKDQDKPKQTWDDFKQVVSNEVETLSNLSTEEQKKLLAETEEKLISKRHAVLDDITIMSGSLRQWEIERNLTNILSAEIVSLREQLRIAEEKLQGQKVKLQTIQPKVTLYHEKINTGRKECFRLSKICNGLGQQIIGSGYKVPTAGAELLNNKIKDVATHTQKLRGKIVQNNNGIKTGRSLKNNPKTNVNPNLNMKRFNKKQNNTVNSKVDKSDSSSKRSVVEKEKIMENDAYAVVSNDVKARTSKNIFNKQNNTMSMDVDNGNSSINVASTKKSQSTNLNNDRDQSINSKQLANSEIVQDAHSKEASSVTVNNDVTSIMEIDSQSDFNTINDISNKHVGTNEKSVFKTINNDGGAVTSNVDQATNLETNQELNNIKQTVDDNSEASNKEIVEEGKPNSKNVKANSESKIKTNGILNNNAETSSIAIVGKSSKCASNEESSVSTPSQISDVARIVSNETSSNSEKLPAVRVGQSADVTENSIETDSQKQLEEASENLIEITVQNNVSTKSENIVDEIHTLNPILNNTVDDVPDKMGTEIADVNLTNETRTNEQSTNSGPTIVITDNVKSDSVNNSTSGVVNTSLDDYMEEITVSDDYNNVCSKDYKSSASVTSNEHSTTFDEEIRLLEIASESDASHELTSVYQSTAITEHENIDNFQAITKTEHNNCQSEVKAPQKAIDNCPSITRLEREFMNNCRSSVMKIERLVTDNSSTQSLSKTTSKKAFRPYESILKLVRAPRNDKTDGILCPFALMGTCIDDECRYIHQPTSHCR